MKEKLLGAILGKLLSGDILEKIWNAAIGFICNIIREGAKKTETDFDDAIAEQICKFLEGLEKP